MEEAENIIKLLLNKLPPTKPPAIIYGTYVEGYVDALHRIKEEMKEYIETFEFRMSHSDQTKDMIKLIFDLKSDE